jgi:hypothetical protein
MTPRQLAEIVEAGFHSARGKDDELALALYAMAQKAREIARREQT